MNLERKHLRNYKSLVSGIKKEWSDSPKDWATNLVQSIKNRISDFITNKGNFIMY